jgi:methylmalonyl-CoA mutase N-terminal domain/subunit
MSDPKDFSRWQEKTLRPALKKSPLRKESFQTHSNIEVPDLWPAPDQVHGEPLGYPGEHPYTRGVQPSMYRGRFWTMRQYAGFGDAEESNQRYRYLLQQGQTGLSVAFDLPTQMGHDPDSPWAKGEVGKVGVSIASLVDMQTLLSGIPLDQVSTSMTINATAGILLALYIAVAEKQGVPAKKLQGTIQNDLLKEYIARGTYIYPPAPSMRIICDIFAYASREVPKWNTISISGYHIREAGSDAVQEVAFTLADGIAYVEAARSRGLDVDDFAGRLSFFFNVHNNFLEEVAKFRAARRMWAEIMRSRFGAKDPKSCQLRFHSQTAGSTLTAQQPEVNIVRVTLQALAAVLGGTQSLHTNSMDEALGLPTAHAAKLALRTQQVIAHESGVADVVDAFGGSYAVESLTDQIETRARALLEKIDQMGGMVRAIEEGFPQKQIEETSYQYQVDIERGERVVVGQNRFQEKEERPPEVLKVNPALEEKALARLRTLRNERNAQQAAEALAAVEAAARGSDNLMPRFVDAVKAHCTVGEISNRLRLIFGEYRPS